MVCKDQTYVVMGLLDTDSIAYAIGRTIECMGGKTVYTVQNERIKSIFLDSGRGSGEDASDIDFRFCDVTIEEEVRTLFEQIGPVGGVVHSIAYANPRTCLGEEFHTQAVDDITLAHHISCISLATVARHAQGAMPSGGSIVALSFDTARVFPYYNWIYQAFL